MTDSQPDIGRPFPPGVALEKPGQGRKKLLYIPTHAVVARLNECLGVGSWSWRVVDFQILGDTVLIRGELTHPRGSILAGEDAAPIVMKRDGSSPVPDALANAVKTASSGALVRASRLLGIGLYLYRDGAPSEAEAEEKRDRAPASKRQLQAISAQARLLRWGSVELREAAGKSSTELTFGGAARLIDDLAEAVRRQAALATHEEAMDRLPEAERAQEATDELDAARPINDAQRATIRGYVEALSLDDDLLNRWAIEATGVHYRELDWEGAATLIERLALLGD